VTGEATIIALVPARNEAATVAATVRALRASVDQVVVVDDASSDGTASLALGAGATVLRIRSQAGKGAAMEGALTRLPPHPGVWLFADADLGVSAAGLAKLLPPVLDGRADMAIAGFPPQGGGGLGTVKRFSSLGIKVLSGYGAGEPLSGQRVLSAACLAAVRPLAGGFGMETAMTIDAVRRGFRIVEVPVAGLTHRSTGRGLPGFAHRGKEGLHIARAIGARAVRLR
jgi:glycosyltransferase involved in cell wall biosynthesis